MVTERRRGAPRSEPARLAILSSAAELLLANGYAHLTMEGIAAAAKVGKQTIYRWWPSKSALVADCLVEGLIIPDWFVPSDTGDFEADISRWLHDLIAFIDQPGNDELVRSLVTAGAENEDVAAKLQERLGVFTLLGDRAATGGIPVDPEFGEAVLGAVILRVMQRRPFDADFVPHLVGLLMRGIRG